MYASATPYRKSTRILPSAHNGPLSRRYSLKISAYCSALECLFCEESGEIAHQLAERVACYLASDGSARLILYREVKEAYGVRSRVVHGDTLKDRKLENLARVSTSIDEVVRRVLRKVDDDVEYARSCSNRTEFDAYMLRLVFGVSA